LAGVTFFAGAAFFVAAALTAGFAGEAFATVFASGLEAGVLAFFVSFFFICYNS
jgi:hypothetical protein